MSGAAPVVLNGPWKFRVGDDPSWSAPGTDDSSWEPVDLTAPSGAHDGDIGLSRYVPGWTARGHPGYAGFGWYRLQVDVGRAKREGLALLGPPAVDSAYQVFVDGAMVGSAGDFSGPVPVTYSIQPRSFVVPETGHDRPGRITLAFRVWMEKAAATVPGAGGIHIAPVLGPAASIGMLYDRQWQETIRGYVVEVGEALMFAVLAAAAWRWGGSAGPWLAAAMLLTGLQRANQAVYFWAQVESTREAEVLIGAFVIPFALGIWTRAWLEYLVPPGRRWERRVVVAATLLYVLLQLPGRTGLSASWPASFVGVLRSTSTDLRLVFLAFLVWAAIAGRRQGLRAAGLPVLALVLVSIGLFASELGRLGVPGIWFPFGTGVSRTQYAYAAFGIVMALVLLRRHRISGA